jgi:hypothetical protein
MHSASVAGPARCSSGSAPDPLRLSSLFCSVDTQLGHMRGSACTTKKGAKTLLGKAKLLPWSSNLRKADKICLRILFTEDTAVGELDACMLYGSWAIA